MERSSSIAAALRLRFDPVALSWRDGRPEGARQFQEGRWGCLMWLLAHVIPALLPGASYLAGAHGGVTNPFSLRVARSWFRRHGRHHCSWGIEEEAWKDSGGGCRFFDLLAEHLFVAFGLHHDLFHQVVVLQVVCRQYFRVLGFQQGLLHITEDEKGLTPG